MNDPILRSLLHAILEEPFRDLHRLAYADRCEELDDDARAEFIRIQIELARMTLMERTAGTCNGYYCDVTADGHEVHRDCRFERLKHRERELWAVAAEQSLQLDEPLWGLPACHIKDWSPNRMHLINLHTNAYFTFRRGFVEEISLTLADYLTHAHTLFAAHPITTVTVTDAIIFPSSGNNNYFVGGLGNFPRRYWAKLDNLPNRKAALAAVANVCVHLGRHRARLPELKPAIGKI